MNADAIVDIDTRDAVIEAVAKFRRFIRYGAMVLAGGEVDVAEDLEQEAYIVLWELDPSRFDADDDGYLLRAVFKRMQWRYRGHFNTRGGIRRVEDTEKPQ